MMARVTKADRRRRGRAIRKARREQAAAVEAVMSFDWSSLGRFVLEAFEEMGRMFGQALDATVAVLEGMRAETLRRQQWDAAEAARARRDWMLTHRALAAVSSTTVPVVGAEQEQQ